MENLPGNLNDLLQDIEGNAEEVIKGIKWIGLYQEVKSKSTTPMVHKD